MNLNISDDFIPYVKAQRFKNKHKLFNISLDTTPEICTGPIFVDYLTTTTTFPITHGTVVMVTCDSDYVLSGSYVITCYRDRNYLFASTPKCVDKGTY